MESSGSNSQLQSILRFAVEHTKLEDAPNPSSARQLNKEDAEFLENALKSTNCDIMEELKKAVDVLENDSTLEEKKQSLNIIRDYVDDIDFANNFVKIGGANTIIKYVQMEETELRTSAIYIISDMSQNNIFCQKYFLEKNVISLLVSNFGCDDDVSRSSIQAVSSLVSNFEPGLAEFLSVGGIRSLLTTLTSDYTKVYIKASFLVAKLSLEQPIVRDEFVKRGATSILMNNIDQVDGFDIKVEITLRALAELSRSSEWKVSSEKQYLDIKQKLSGIVLKNENKPECEDIVLYAKNVLANLHSPSGN